VEVNVGAARVGRAFNELVEVCLRSGHLGALDPAGAEALKKTILDGFARGDVDEALKTLIAAAPSRRHERAVKQLLDSTLMSLGVRPEQALEGWRATFKALSVSSAATPQPLDLRASPVRDAFRGLPIDAAALTTLRRQTLATARLAKSVDLALGAPDRAAALDKLVARLDLASTPDETLMAVLVGYREVEAWPKVLALVEAAPSEFRELPTVRRETALALGQSGRTSEARDVLRKLVQDGDHSPSTLGLFGRLAKDKYDRMVAAGESGEAVERMLLRAISAYRAGFNVNRAELYPGVALPTMLETLGTRAALDEARSIATAVRDNGMRRAAFGNGDYWDAAAALEMTLFLEQPVGPWLERTLACVAEPWMRRSTAQNISRVADVRAARGQDVTALRAIAAQLTSAPPAPVPEPARVQAQQPRPDGDDRRVVLDALLDCTYRTSGTSPKWLSGNYNYAGIAHDVRVTPADLVYFRRVMERAGLDQVTNPLEASAKMDLLVRARFDTAAMEDRESPEHVRYDQLMPALARVMSATSDNSQTNVSADWLNALGDCRQHAPVKLILWTVWKRAQTAKLLEHIQQASATGRGGEVDTLRRRLEQLNAWELRVFDAEIVDARDGRMLEEHTMTLLVRREARPLGEVMDTLAEVHLADAFYQSKFPLGDGVAAARTRDGRLWIDVPKPAADGTPIALRPAAYSFDRAEPSVDYGQLLFRGREVARPGWEMTIPTNGVDLVPLHELASTFAKAANDDTPPSA
jgi:hypothetical protein